MTKRLEGKAGIVTGAAMGLGRAVLEACVAEGAQIVAFDRDAQAGAAAVDCVIQGGDGARFFHGDVRNEHDWEAAVELCQGEFGSFNILDNNAAIAVEGHLHEAALDEWNDIVDVNLRGTFLGCRHAVCAMREGGGGSIVNTGSIAGLSGDPLLPAYGATKAAVIGLTRSVAVDYAVDNIRCNALCPGDMVTPMLERTFARATNPDLLRSEMEQSYPVGRLAQAAEVATAVVYLLSDEASFVTGSVVIVDGGLTAKCY